MRALLLATALAGALGAQTRDTVLQAMHDELERSRSLAVPGLEKPYYIEYGIDDADSFSCSATLGGLVTRRRDRFRLPTVKVRVGSYKFDNGNYVYSGGVTSGRLPLEDSYETIRRFLWLDTDTAYKSAVQSISRKRAALRNLTSPESLNDFAPAAPLQLLRPVRRAAFDEEAAVARARSLSAIFLDYPQVRNSSVDLESVQSVRYFANTEGTEVRHNEGTSFVRVRAQAQAPDGMLVRDASVFVALDPYSLPLDTELRRGIQAVAANATALARAPRGEDYNGPVLFEGVAAAQLLAQVLGHNLVPTRRPVMEPGRGGSFPTSEFEGRQGARVMPEWIDVIDDPTQKEWRGHTLFGSYEVDREGVAAVPLTLIEKGVLKQFLLTRQPVRGAEGSNGRARLPGAGVSGQGRFSNLFVRAAERTPLAELKRKLLDICQARGKPYGILVRKLDFPSSAATDELRRMLASQRGSSRPVSRPVMIYKVFPGGREQLVRGLEFRGLNARSLKDILAAGDDETFFDFLDSAAPLALMGAGGYAAESCVVAPSVLIDDLELRPLEDELPKLPVVAPPELVRVGR